MITIVRIAMTELSPRRRAALVASTLARIAPLVDQLAGLWPSLQLPSAAIVEAYVRLANGMDQHLKAWKFDMKSLDTAPPNLYDLLESSVETFALASKGLIRLDPILCERVLEAAEELVEALAQTVDGNKPDAVLVEIEGDQPWIIGSERQVQASQRERVRALADAELESGVSDLLRESQTMGEVYRTALLKSFRTPQPRMANAVRNGGTRQDKLLALLKSLSRQDWEHIEACADKIDRLSASGAARAAMAVIGIHPTHELFVRVTRELRLPERSRAWDIAADSLLAAAAWDGLEPAKRQALTECLAENDSVKGLLDRW